MPSINEIAVKMTADTTQAVHGFMQVDKEIKKLMRVQKALQDAGMGDGQQSAGITKMIGELRELQGQFDTSTGSVSAYKDTMAGLAPGMEKSVRTTEGLIARMRDFDASIKTVQTQLNALNSAGIKDTNGALASQIASLQSAKQSMITYSGAARMSAEELHNVARGATEATSAMSPLTAAANAARTALASMGGGGTVGKLQALDSQIRRLQADLRYMASNGLRPATNAIRNQIVALQAQQKALITASGTVRQMTAAQRQLNNSMMMTARGSGRMNVAMTQASFGVEDFMTQLGPMGLGGALRAAGNNMSMVAHSLGGWKAGAIVGITAAILPMLINMLDKTGQAADRVSKKIKELTESTVTLRELESKTILESTAGPLDNKRHKRELEDLKNSQKSSEDMKKVRHDAVKSERNLQDELVIVRKAGTEKMIQLRKDLEDTGAAPHAVDAYMDAVGKGEASAEDGLDGFMSSMEGITERKRKAFEEEKNTLKLLRMTNSGGGVNGTPQTDAQRELIARQEAIVAQAKKEHAEKVEQQKKINKLREDEAGSAKDIHTALEREKVLVREIAQAREKQDVALEEIGMRGHEERNRQDRKDRELARLKGEETGVQDELKELSKASQAVSGSFSSQVNTGAAVAAAVADKFNTDKDIKRETLNETLKQIRDEQKKVTKIKVVGNY